MIRSSHDLFRHEALFYTDEDEFLAGTAPFVREGLAAEEPVMVAVGPARIRALEAELGGDADAVDFVDMVSLGRNPACIIPAWRGFAERQSAGGPLRGIGEPVWPGRTSAELTECQRHESLLNFAFADEAAFWLLCPYDAGGLADEVLEDAMRSHPVVSEGRTTRASDTYTSPELATGPFGGKLPAPKAPIRELRFGVGDLPALRRFVADQAAGAGLRSERTSDLVLAVNELAANSVLHAGGDGSLHVWEEADELLCEIRDQGRLEGMLLGRVRPRIDDGGGHGLWLVNHLCDLVQIRSSDAGTYVRLHMTLR
jgi:anti-sigma regulatory factor (Ser/Thr protein kinase)